MNAFRAVGGEPALGDLVAGRYRLTKVLASRETTVVYEAVDAADGTRVVVKRLRREASESVRRRFRREYECVLVATGDDVVRVHAFVDDETDEAIVFERLDGESLASRLEREGPLEEDVVMATGLSLFGAIGRLHERRLVHRDIKPENVWLGSRGVTLVDFGVAFDESSRTAANLTPIGIAMGTPRYAAPESLAGEVPPGRALDLYAAAITLFEALVGAHPFEAPSSAEFYERVLEGVPTPVAAFRRDLTRDWGPFFAKSLARDRSVRWASAADLRQALAQLSIVA